MATTYFKKHHISRGETIARSMRDRFDYGMNPDKTRGGELIMAYECDPETADAEFLLSKAKYRAVTGREQKEDADVLCYQIRQSFMPGETDSGNALKMGYDLAMRWTKGNHAFFVVSHIDRPHPHVHIYFNSTALDCTRKFRDFIGSARAVRQLSDRICIENRLSVITNPKLKSKGQYRHYGEWLGSAGRMSFREQLKNAIDGCLAKEPKDADEFLALMSGAGYEHKCGRGSVLSFRNSANGQKAFIRLRASVLGEGYGQDELLSVISGGSAASAVRAEVKPRKVSLVIDIEEKIRSGKGAAFERWARIYNLKMMAEALQYLQENSLLEYGQLESRTESAVERVHSLAEKIQNIEAAMKRNAGLKSAIVEYARTRPVFEEYKAKKYSRAYLAEHGDDIAAYRAAGAAMREILGGEKLPKTAALKAEWQRLISEKKRLYAEYRSAQKEMREVVAVKGNIDQALDVTVGQKNKEQER